MASNNSNGFTELFDGEEFNAHLKANKSESAGFDNPCLRIEDDEASTENKSEIHSKNDSVDRVGSTQSSDDTSASSSQIMTSLPVLYTTGTGNSKVVKEEVIINRPGGKNVIQTSQTCCQNVPERWRDIERQRPLRQRHIKFLKIFSIIAAVLFFPIGIPAVYYAFQLQTAFDDGIIQGNIDRAISLRKRVERLIIFSGLFALLTAILIFALVERSILENDKNNMANRILPG